MPTREIPRDEWGSFLDSFSRQHAGWLSTVEVLSSIGAQVQSREQPLSGITAELKGGNRDLISILIGTTSDDHVTHVIHAPSYVRLKETAEGAHEALQIESENGVTTLLTFRSTIPSELVDGYVSR
jgi:Family of unknown function (DUF5335)